ncbi:unnamed protein product [Calypogeia fissa]
MGNALCISDGGESKKHKIDNSHVVPMTSSSLQNITVEFPKEIEEDLERRKIESLKALAAARKKGPARTTSAPVYSSTDPAHDFYEKARGLDVPAVMVPKPWSEVDQILTKLKTSDAKEAPSPKPNPAAAPKVAELKPTETIDMSELMDDLFEADDDEEKVAATKMDETTKPSLESLTLDDLTPKQIRSLESSLSFSTIHTVLEVEGGNAKPESVTNILKSRSPAGVKSSSAMAPTTPKKVNVHPRLLARMEAFM